MMLACSYVTQKNAVSRIRIFNPYGMLEETDKDFYYYDIPGIPPAKETMSQMGAILFRGFMGESTAKLAKWIKASYPRCRTILDNDDLVWGGELPDYNFFNPMYPNTEAKRREMAVWMKTMDFHTFSTEYLRARAVSDFGIDPRRTLVVPNAVSKSDWYRDGRVEKDIEVPKVLYMASDTHYSNTKKDLGDWTENLVDWVCDSVKDGKIEFVCVGGFPWFFEVIKDRIKHVGWLPYYKLPLVLKEIGAHFSINPLRENTFNRAKSDIKLVESAACGMVCVGTEFHGSPYSSCLARIRPKSTKKEIGKLIFGLCKEKTFNKTLEKQLSWIETEGRWLDSAKHLDLLRRAVGLKT